MVAQIRIMQYIKFKRDPNTDWGHNPWTVNAHVIEGQYCSHCGADKGYYCKNKSTKIYSSTHIKRYNEWVENGRQ